MNDPSRRSGPCWSGSGAAGVRRGIDHGGEDANSIGEKGEERDQGTVVHPGLVFAVLNDGCSGPHWVLMLSSPATGSAQHADTVSTTCHRPLPSRPVVAAPITGVPSDWDVTSFDGTVIRAHWFPRSTYVPGATGRYPTVLMGPGWSESGDTDSRARAVLGMVPIPDDLDAGYNVRPWDRRGFGQSGGEDEVDSPEVRGDGT